MMNKIKLVLISILSVFLLFTSCKKDDDQVNEQKEKNYLSAKVDGVDFFTDFPIYLSPTKEVLTVSGQNKQNTINVQISIADYNGPGTYDVGNNIQNENAMIIINNGVWLADKDNGSGTVTFMEEGKFLNGTFSFDPVHSQNGTTKKITEGKFNVQIIF